MSGWLLLADAIIGASPLGLGGRVDVRHRDGTCELRCLGIPDASQQWTAIGSTTPDRIGDVRVR